MPGRVVFPLARGGQVDDLSMLRLEVEATCARAAPRAARDPGPPLRAPRAELPGRPGVSFGAPRRAAFLTSAAALAFALAERESFLRTSAACAPPRTPRGVSSGCALPAALVAAFLSARLYARMRRAPSLFVGAGVARPVSQ